MVLSQSMNVLHIENYETYLAKSSGKEKVGFKWQETLVESFKTNKKRKAVVVDSHVEISSEDNTGTKMSFDLSLANPLLKVISNEQSQPHINSETNPSTPIINVACKYLRQFLGSSYSVAALLTCCNIE